MSDTDWEAPQRPFPETPPTIEMPRPPVEEAPTSVYSPPVPPPPTPSSPPPYAYPGYAFPAPGPAPVPPPVRGRRAWLSVAALLAAIAFLAAGFGIARYVDDDTPTAAGSDPGADVQPVATTAATLIDNAPEPVAAVAAVVAPSVVQIETRQGLGSGVIYDADGLILTAAHVLGDVRSVTVRTADGSTLDGTVVGTSPEFDVAVVRVNPDEAGDGGLPAATLALDVPLQVGQLAVAIGSPFGLDQTVTSGVVSAVDRAVSTPQGALGMIQTDAPINPGNSGGALADRHGRVIGINDAIQSASGGNEGVGFAIPIDVAFSVAERLVAGQPVEFAFLGVESGPVASGRAGAAIKTVVPDSPAEAAGLERGDIVLALDGTPVLSSTDLVALVRSSQPGDQVTLTVERDGQEIEINVTLGTNTN